MKNHSETETNFDYFLHFYVGSTMKSVRGAFTFAFLATIFVVFAASCSREHSRADNESDGYLPEMMTVTLPYGITMDLVYVAPGSFNMGSSHDGPVHQVVLSKGFWIGKTEVTQPQWESVMGNNPSDPDLSSRYLKDGEALPVEGVSWEECQNFILKMNEINPGLKFDLPTEAQWEFAARGGNRSRNYRFSGSDDPDQVAWYSHSPGGPCKPYQPVGLKKANELGIYDMSGNVMEWCSDWYGKYSAEAVTDPTGPSSGEYRTHRGGSYSEGENLILPTSRMAGPESFKFDRLGFRIVAILNQD